MYLCSKTFYTSTVLELFATHDLYGIVMVSGENTHFYTINGTEYNLVKKINIDRQKNQKKGGQSAPRFQRSRVNQIKEYVHVIYDEAKKLYISDSKLIINKLIIAGMGDVKMMVYNELNKHVDLRKITNQPITISQFNISELVKLSQNIISNDNIIKEKSVLEKLNSDIANVDSCLVFGTKDIDKYIKQYQIKKLIIHKNIAQLQRYIDYECEKEIVSDQEFLNNYGGIVGYTYFNMN
jgi:peptide chain release factor subunit 1